MAMLEVKNLGISFGGLRAVDDFHISIEKGQLYGLIGPNGAGKTTVFNMLTGVYTPDEGTISLDGADTPYQIKYAGFLFPINCYSLEWFPVLLYSPYRYLFISSFGISLLHYKNKRFISDIHTMSIIIRNSC